MGCVENTHDLADQRDQADCHDEESFEEVRLTGVGGRRRRGDLGLLGEAVVHRQVERTRPKLPSLSQYHCS